MDFGWWWCVRVGTSVLTIIPVWWRMFIMGEVWGRKGVYGKSLSFLPNFAVNLKLLFKNKAYLKWYVYILKGWLQKSVGHRISRMADIRVKWPTLRESREAQLSVVQSSWGVRFHACSPVRTAHLLPGALSHPLVIGLNRDQFWPMKWEWRWLASLPCQSKDSSVPGPPGFPSPAVAMAEMHMGCKGWEVKAVCIARLEIQRATVMANL